MKKIKKLLAGILALACLLSASILPSFAEEGIFFDCEDRRYAYYDYSNTEKYYVGETYFLYIIGDYSYLMYDTEELTFPKAEDISIEERTLIILAFSESFSRKLVVPDEINGIKVENAVLVDSEYIETVVLSDGIKRFACRENYAVLGSDNVVYHENNIKRLHLGRSFLPDGLYYEDTLYKELFQDLDNLYTITVSEENPYLTSDDGVLYSKDYSSIIAFPANKFKGTAPAKGTTYKLNKNTKIIESHAFENTRHLFAVEGKNIEKINISAFAGSSIKNIVIPKTVKEIYGSVFGGSKIKRVTLKGKIKKIRAFAFANCKNIKFYVKNKARAKFLNKQLKEQARRWGLISAKIYVGKKLHYTIKKN